VLGVLAFAGPAAAAYPDRNVTIVVPYPAGGPTDQLARLVADHLSKKFKQNFIVENVTGGSTIIASNKVAKADPDGYTLLLHNLQITANVTLFKNLPFDTVKSFTPVASFAEIAFMLTVSAKSPIKTVAELTAYLKSRKQNKYGATNQTAILSTEYYKQLAGVDAVHVAYRTAPEALPDVEDGTLDFMIMDGTFAVGPIKAGKIRALAVTTAQRIATLPDVPTMMEAGVGNFEFTPWWGAFVPAGTPQPIVAKLGAWMNQIARTDETRQFLERIAALPLSDDSKATAARLQDDIAKWEPLVKAAKIEPQ
jgi:tripartite-type tricarboxylate transporter receptor subunit TctC